MGVHVVGATTVVKVLPHLELENQEVSGVSN